MMIKIKGKNELYINSMAGITLIALVITIIVLLILAGVAISMLSGENGILKKAAEAKTKTDDAQNEESQTLLSYEFTIDNATKSNTIYKYQEGYITGIKYNSQKQKSENTIQQLEDALPNGYTVAYKYNPQTQKDEEITDKGKSISTGMAIIKDGNTVARTVLFGDIDCDGIVDSSDAIEIMSYYNFKKSKIIKDFQKIAGNVNCDGEINIDDATMALDCFAGRIDDFNNQNIKVKANNIKRMYTVLQRYINSLDKSTGYSFEYNSEEDTYKLKGVKKGTKVETLINALPESDKIKILDNEKDAIENSDEVVDGGYVQYNENENVGPIFAYIELQ